MKKQKLKQKDFGYYLFQLVRYPARWFMDYKLNLNLVKNEAKDDKGPFFITGNHVTAYDPIIALTYLKPLVKFVAADANLDSKLKTFLFKAARVIPISKRTNDVRVIKRLLAEVKAGNSVGLYPEGGRNWIGETDPLIESTAKLIKMLGIKVYCQKLEGAYMTSPRWGKRLHKGVTNVTIYQMLSAEEVKQMTDVEILEALKKHLYHNDYEYQREHMDYLEGNDMAEYIERVIYYCPKCGHFNTFKSHKDEFKCMECDAKGIVNHYGFIEGDFPYDNLVDWYHEERKQLEIYIKENKIKPVELYDVHHISFYEKGNKEKHLVNMTFDHEKLVYYDEMNRYEINYAHISEPSLTFKNRLIFHENKNRHEFIIEPFLHNASIMYIFDLLMLLRGEKNGR